MNRFLPRSRFIPILIAVLIAAPYLHAGWLFGESEEEKAAKVASHVADVLREPNQLIAQAQAAAEANDIEEAIRLFRKAQDLLEAVEADEDTSGSAFATLRLKKFHCVSMLDALALKRAEVMDVRQAVTDTDDLETRLEQERAAIRVKQQTEEKKKQLPSRPPSLREQLAVEQERLAAAALAVKTTKEAQAKILRQIKQAQTDFTKQAQEYAAADAALFMAQHTYSQAELKANEADSEQIKKNVFEARKSVETANATLAEAKAKMEQAKSARETLVAQKTEVEASLKNALAQELTIRRGVEVLQRAVDDETRAAEVKAKAERERQQAEALMRKQAEAAARQKAREEAEALIKKDAQAKAKAQANVDAVKREIAWCFELWHQKNIDVLEPRLTEAALKWPDTPEFMLLLARLRLIQGQLDDALEILETIPTAKTQLGLQTQLVAAGVYLAKNQALEALKVLEKAQKNFPNDPSLFFDMAIVMLRLPEVDPDRNIAAHAYRRSIELGGKRSAQVERKLNME